MLKRINYVKNIGRFYDVFVKGTTDSDPCFKKFNLIYADNGVGKSTIATILKSLCENNPQRLVEKKTIGASDKSTVSLLVNGEEYIFQNEKWNKKPDIAIRIFDEEFVEKNVFSSSSVGTENRRGLFDIVLGEENVDKVNKINELDDQINNDLKLKIETAENKLKKEAEIEDIKTLDKTSKLNNDKLKAMRNQVKEDGNKIAHAERIKKEKQLDKIPDFRDILYEESIDKDLGKLSLEAEYKTHVEKHNLWIADGMGKIIKEGEEESCPFCFQSIKENDAIETYKTFFSQEYNSLRKKVENQISDIEKIYNDDAIQNIISLIERNNERCDFWHKLDETIPESVPLNPPLKDTINQFKNALKSLLQRKKDNLLEAIGPNENERKGLGQEQEFRTAITNYNNTINNLNEKIKSIKDNTQDVEKLKTENEKNNKIVVCNDVRYKNEKTAKIYKNLKLHQKEKETAEKDIIELRNKINKGSLLILKEYQTRINKELKNFGVEFSIEEVKRRSDTVRKEGVGFKICLKGQSFEPNGSDGSPYKLSNTLSSGDKSALAFAFFIAKYNEENISNQILVFDDPITSFDFFRKTQTKNIILKFAEKAKQIFILTHSTEFAKLFKSKKDSHFVRILKKNPPSGLSYTPYNKFSDMYIDKHKRNYNLIQKYLDNPESVNRQEVINAIRPYAETVIKTCRPEFEQLSLGKIIEELRNKGNICEDYIQDLDSINISITREIHGSANQQENITDNELRNLCEKALKISPPPAKQAKNRVGKSDSSPSMSPEFEGSLTIH